MKFLIILIALVAWDASAKCDVEPLKKEIINEYRSTLPVSNSRGEIGHALGRNFVVSESLVNMKNERLLLANFDLDIKWMSGKKQTVRTLVVATVNAKTCAIENFAAEKRLVGK